MGTPPGELAASAGIGTAVGSGLRVPGGKTGGFDTDATLWSTCPVPAVATFRKESAISRASVSTGEEYRRVTGTDFQ